MTEDTHAMWLAAVAERDAALEERRCLRLQIAGLEERNEQLERQLVAFREEMAGFESAVDRELAERPVRHDDVRTLADAPRSKGAT